MGQLCGILPGRENKRKFWSNHREVFGKLVEMNTPETGTKKEHIKGVDLIATILGILWNLLEATRFLPDMVCLKNLHPKRATSFPNNPPSFGRNYGRNPLNIPKDNKNR